MNCYHVVIDSDMIRNAMQTNIEESCDLYSLKLILYVLLLGVAPSILIYKKNIINSSFKVGLYKKDMEMFR